MKPVPKRKLQACEEPFVSPDQIHQPLIFSKVVGPVAAIVAASIAIVVLVGLWLVVPLFGGEEEQEER